MARYEINHEGKIVESVTERCENKDEMIIKLFSQFGWKVNELEKDGPFQKLSIEKDGFETIILNVFSGNIRNESRNDYEKKIQLNGKDPIPLAEENTIILGVYTFKKNDTLADTLFVGYPIDKNVKYNTNPSLRGAFINGVLVNGKNKGFYFDKEKNLAAFRPEFIFYYLENYKNLHYNSDEKSPLAYVDNKNTENEWIIEYQEYKTDKKRNRIVFGAPGTGKSHKIEKDRKDWNLEKGSFERVTFHPDYSYANFVGTYKPVMIKEDDQFIGEEEKNIIAILSNKSMTAQEKYDVLYDRFNEEGSLTRLPVLLGLYTDEDFKTRKADGTSAVGDNSVERNHGKAIRQYVELKSNYKKSKGIAYEYVPGPFMRILVKALENPAKPYLLIIEEINRAQIAAVFGDVFQLLDRKSEGYSEYAIATSEDMRKYLSEKLEVDESQLEEIRIPSNMFIWASMNSADQGVFPMDTAFKRRWEFDYIGIDEKEDDLPSTSVAEKWNIWRKAINKYLSSKKINEDKLMGPFFISKSVMESNDESKFNAVFKNKVIMYLFEDAGKRCVDLFSGCSEDERKRYSLICDKFDKIGIKIFDKSIWEGIE